MNNKVVAERRFSSFIARMWIVLNSAKTAMENNNGGILQNYGASLEKQKLILASIQGHISSKSMAWRAAIVTCCCLADGDVSIPNTRAVLAVLYRRFNIFGRD